MKCPKCGQEYEGSACPNCEPGPEIIVNNADYLRRKEAYAKEAGCKKSLLLLTQTSRRKNRKRKTPMTAEQSKKEATGTAGV